MEIPGTGIRIGVRSVSGRREVNEDGTIAVSRVMRGGEPVLCAAAADGVGSSGTGSLASSTALGALREAVDSAASGVELRVAMKQAFQRANHAVREALKGQPQGGGTTLAAVLLRGSKVVVGHVGDSRVYRIRKGAIERLTKDHNLAEESLSAGTDVGTSNPLAHALTRAIGQEGSLAVDLAPRQGELEMQEGDIFVLCTDGVSGSVAKPLLDDNKIRDTVLVAESVDAGADLLVREAYALGSTDNVTAVVVERGRHERKPKERVAPSLPREAAKPPAPPVSRAGRRPAWRRRVLGGGIIAVVGILAALIGSLFGGGSTREQTIPAVAGPQSGEPTIDVTQKATDWGVPGKGTVVATVELTGAESVVVTVRVNDAQGQLTLTHRQAIHAGDLLEAVHPAPTVGTDWRIVLTRGWWRKEIRVRGERVGD